MGFSRSSPLGLRLPVETSRPEASRAGVVARRNMAVTFAGLGAAALALWRVSPAAGALGGVIAFAVLAAALWRRHRPPPAWVLLDSRGVHRLERGRATALVTFAGDPPRVGVSVFASADRGTLLVALTSPGSVRYVAARVRDAEDAAAAPTLIAHAMTAADADLVGVDACSLSAADAERLALAIAGRCDGAVDRAYLSDCAGEPVVIERSEVRIGRRRIDLTMPLEWRAVIFQELGAYAVSVYQATWVRQGEVEVVFVAPIPAEGAMVRSPSPALQSGGQSIVAQAALARDVRLMQTAPGEPPPRELRRAIDRAFMLPLRVALDRAPRVGRAVSPPPSARTVSEARRSEPDRREKTR